MKIAHVQVVPQLSGAQQVSLDILSSLDSEKNELYMICGKIQNFSSDFVEKFNEIGVTLIEVPGLRRDIGKHDIAAFKDLYNIFKKYLFSISCFIIYLFFKGTSNPFLKNTTLR